MNKLIKASLVSFVIGFTTNAFASTYPAPSGSYVDQAGGEEIARVSQRNGEYLIKFDGGCSAKLEGEIDALSASCVSGSGYEQRFYKASLRFANHGWELTYSIREYGDEDLSFGGSHTAVKK